MRWEFAEAGEFDVESDDLELSRRELEKIFSANRREEGVRNGDSVNAREVGDLALACRLSFSAIGLFVGTPGLGYDIHRRGRVVVPLRVSDAIAIGVIDNFMRCGILCS